MMQLSHSIKAKNQTADIDDGRNEHAHVIQIMTNYATCN